MTDMLLEKIGSRYDELYGFHDPEKYTFKSSRGLTEEIVRSISGYKAEPEWMLRFRLKALEIFQKKPMPTWGDTERLESIDFDNIHYYVKPSERQERNWEDVPPEIRNTFDRLGIPEAERKYLAGVTAQYESEVVYHSIQKDLEKEGVIFLSMDDGLKQYPEIVKQYFGTVIPPADNKFAALNSAVWSGGSFVYVPKGVHVAIPLQAYFRINTENMGQFERTLIIVEEGASAHYIEGCTAPTYSTDSLHSAVVELIARPGAKLRYTTIQNWSKNVFNLVTKRAVAYRDATVEWVDGNLGSKLTMKYPAVILKEPGAHGEVLSIAFAGDDQHQDAGAKMIHAAPRTTSVITSKSISKGKGRSTYRGMVKVNKGCEGVKSSVVCDALLLHESSRTDTYPTMEIAENDAQIGHEATVSKVSDAQLYYLQSRGIPEDEAMMMIVNGFIEPFTKELPLEYAVELNRLIQLEMEGSVG
ncbi:MAG: Fe-S cluster assembly protein SufB [Deltaproteobacteria bacterium]|nr:Fe-S cluster assembly protein SufB [Deltaproteobacteria bacterium]